MRVQLGRGGRWACGVMALSLLTGCSQSGNRLTNWSLSWGKADTAVAANKGEPTLAEAEADDPSGATEESPAPEAVAADSQPKEKAESPSAEKESKGLIPWFAERKAAAPAPVPAAKPSLAPTTEQDEESVDIAPRLAAKPAREASFEKPSPAAEPAAPAEKTASARPWYSFDWLFNGIVGEAPAASESDRLADPAVEERPKPSAAAPKSAEIVQRETPIAAASPAPAAAPMPVKEPDLAGDGLANPPEFAQPAAPPSAALAANPAAEEAPAAVPASLRPAATSATPPSGVVKASFLHWFQADGAAEPARSWVNHTQGVPFVIGFEQGMAEAQSSGKPAMMFVTTTHCMWCERMAADCFKDPAIRAQLDGFVCVLVDAGREPAVAQKLGAAAYPHLVFVGVDGKKLASSTGYIKATQFQALLDQAAPPRTETAAVAADAPR